MMRTYILPLLLTIIATASCRQNSALESSLQYAGDNRTELEKVIAHYSIDVADSLKLKAAEFLIINMPGHYSYNCTDIDSYYAEIEDVMEMKQISPKEKKVIIDEIANNYPAIAKKIIEDIHIITSEYLIYNIDKAFDSWQTKPWAQHLTFNQFCEYILPYKVAELQKFDSWRDTLSHRFAVSFETLNSNDDDRNSTYTASRYLNYYIGCTITEHLEVSLKYPLLNSSIYKLAFGSCNEYTYLNVSISRSLGIPASFESIPIWGYYGPGGHGMLSFLNDNGMRFLYIWGFGGSNEPGAFFPTRPVPKVYRFGYAKNRRHETYLQEAKYIHPLVKTYRFSQDVTNEFIATSNLSIPVSTKGIKDKYVYLCLFDGHKWETIDYGEIKKGHAHFRNIGRDIIYLVYGYNGVRLVPISDPFLLKTNDSVEYYKGDKSDTRTIRLLRKYLVDWHVGMMEQRIIGGKIEASNDINFIQHEDLYNIDSLYYPDKIEITPSKPYRYWRFRSAQNSFCSLAELQFYENSIDSLPVKGIAIGSPPEMGYERENVFDGDYLTSYTSIAENNAWIGIDFGSPKAINNVRIIPRSDDNRIHVGDTYKLEAWREGAWEMMGLKTAQDNQLFFDSVPNNSVLLLTNLTRGKQKRIFTYTNDKQIFR